MKIEAIYSKKYNATMVLISSGRHEYSKLLGLDLTDIEFFKDLREIINDAEFAFKQIELGLPLALSLVMCTNALNLQKITE